MFRDLNMKLINRKFMYMHQFCKVLQATVFVSYSNLPTAILVMSKVPSSLHNSCY